MDIGLIDIASYNFLLSADDRKRYLPPVMRSVQQAVAGKEDKQSPGDDSCVLQKRFAESILVPERIAVVEPKDQFQGRGRDITLVPTQTSPRGHKEVLFSCMSEAQDRRKVLQMATYIPPPDGGNILVLTLPSQNQSLMSALT